VPWWVPLLEVAEKWHAPPWVIEEDAPQVWMDRWRAWRDEQIAAQPKRKNKPPVVASE
jgi:hypothetical protein